MGNHNGTVYCSYCHGRGHNSRTCAGLTERLLATMYEHLEGTSPIGQQQAASIAKRIGKRTGTNPLTRRKITRRGPPRRCSYCKYEYGRTSDEGIGHTRRTCTGLKKYIESTNDTNRAYRIGMLDSLRSHGIGVGTLLSINFSGYYDTPDGEKTWGRSPQPCMVSRIDWALVCYKEQTEPCIVVKRLDNLADHHDHGKVQIPFPVLLDGTTARFDPQSRQWGPEGVPYRIGLELTEILSKLPADSINAPAGWLEKESPKLSDHFNRLKS